MITAKTANARSRNPFHLSRGLLAAILPLFPRRLQLPIPLGLNLLLMPRHCI
jgi:hypothetical protein